MEPGSTHTLTHLPEESQITKQWSCPRGPEVRQGDKGCRRKWRLRGEGAGKRRLGLQPVRRAIRPLIP